jgi:hypothetical protein
MEDVSAAESWVGPTATFEPATPDWTGFCVM